MQRPRPASAARGAARSYGPFRGWPGALPVALGLGFALALASPSAAQTVSRAAAPASATIPVVERFDPATGRRARRTVAELTTGQILAIQRALARAGYDPGVRGGALDRPTRSALSAFQRARDLPACGCPSYATVVALGLQPQVVETVVGSGRRQPRFAHATTGAAQTLAPARGGQGPAGSVSVTTEAGVVVVRGSGSGAAADRSGAPAAPGAAGAATPEPAPRPTRGDALLEPSYGFYPGLIYGGWLVPPRHPGERHGPARRRPIPYAPRLPDPRPAAPGLPPSLPPHPGSGSGGG